MCDPEHKKCWNRFEMDGQSFMILSFLKDSEMMDKEAYCELFQKAINRNYNLTEFDDRIKGWIDGKERELARIEILENVYCPNPKTNWQKSASFDKKTHSTRKIEIPNKLSKKENIEEELKKALQKQGKAKEVKIKTDMTKYTEDGVVLVDNLEDWLIRIIQLEGTKSVCMPPQTPDVAVELLQETIRRMENPDYGEHSVRLEM